MYFSHKLGFVPNTISRPARPSDRVDLHVIPPLELPPHPALDHFIKRVHNSRKNCLDQEYLQSLFETLYCCLLKRDLSTPFELTKDSSYLEENQSFVNKVQTLGFLSIEEEKDGFCVTVFTPRDCNLKPLHALYHSLFHAHFHLEDWLETQVKELMTTVQSWIACETHPLSFPFAKVQRSHILQEVFDLFEQTPYYQGHLIHFTFQDAIYYTAQDPLLFLPLSNLSTKDIKQSLILFLQWQRTLHLNNNIFGFTTELGRTKEVLNVLNKTFGPSVQTHAFVNQNQETFLFAFNPHELDLPDPPTPKALMSNILLNHLLTNASANPRNNPYHEILIEGLDFFPQKHVDRFIKKLQHANPQLSNDQTTLTIYQIDASKTIDATHATLPEDFEKLIPAKTNHRQQLVLKACTLNERHARNFFLHAPRLELEKTIHIQDIPYFVFNNPPIKTSLLVPEQILPLYKNIILLLEEKIDQILLPEDTPKEILGIFQVLQTIHHFAFLSLSVQNPGAKITLKEKPSAELAHTFHEAFLELYISHATQ